MIKLLLDNEIDIDEVLRYYNANISYIDLPLSIRGCVYYYKGIYDILINKN